MNKVRCLHFFLILILGVVLTGCKLTGRVTTPGGDPIDGVTLTLSGEEPATAVTDVNGEYEFVVPNAIATYTVTAACDQFVFEPESREVDTSVAVDDRTSTIDGIDFTGRRVEFTLHGRVTLPNGKYKPNVTVALSGGMDASVLTNGYGEYRFNIPGDFATYTLTPSMEENFVFTPVSRTVEINETTPLNTGIINGLDFVAQGVSYTLMGTLETSGRTPIPNATVTLSGDLNATTTSDTNGAYSFQVPVEDAVYSIAATLPESYPRYELAEDVITARIDSLTVKDQYNRISGFDFTAKYVVSPEYEDITYYQNCDTQNGPMINAGESDPVIRFDVIEENTANGTGYWGDSGSIFPFFLSQGASELYAGNFSIEQGRIGFYLRVDSPPSEAVYLINDEVPNMFIFKKFYVKMIENVVGIFYGGTYQEFEVIVPMGAWVFFEMKFEDNTATIIIDGTSVGRVVGVDETLPPEEIHLFGRSINASKGQFCFDQIMASSDPERSLYELRDEAEF